MGLFRWLFGKNEQIESSAIEHSSKGSFTYDPKTNRISKMKSGGHGQENIDFLTKNKINYNIVYEYKNGVRIGNVPKHKEKYKRNGTGQSWFPKNWGRKEISDAGKYVARYKAKKPDGKQATAKYKGVIVGIIRTNGKVATIYPDVNQKGKYINDSKRYYY